LKASRNFRTTLIIALGLSLLGQASTSQAATKVNPKPGSIVKATIKEKLTVGMVGFTDESGCSTYYEDGSCRYNTIEYQTTWAFSVKNASPSRSASNVRAQVVFKDVQGNVLLQAIVSVAREIKPGKLSWVASSDDHTTSKITGVASASAKIVTSTWIVPTNSIYQNPVELVSASKGFSTKCQTSLPCETTPTTSGHLTTIELTGPFTWRGVGGTAVREIIYLDANNNPLGGWSTPQISYETGSQATRNTFALTAFEIGNVVKFLYAVNN